MQSHEVPTPSNLKGVDAVMYRTAYAFEMNHCNGTPETAHAAGLKEIVRINKLREEESKPKMYVNLSTGRRFMATENELEAMNELG
jgi:hypothetical protein